MANYGFKIDRVAVEAAAIAACSKVTRVWLAGCQFSYVWVETSSDMDAGEIAAVEAAILLKTKTLTKID